MPKIKNIIIFVAVGTFLALIYIYFIKPSSNSSNLISATPVSAPNTLASLGGGSVANDFLALLLSVKSIKLDDTIFSDNAFINLHDSSITLTGDGTEGRSNPFAPLGVDNVAVPVPIQNIPSITTTPLTPSVTPSITPPNPSTTLPNILSPAVTGPVKKS